MPADPLLTLDHSNPIVTIQSHLLSEQARIPGSTGTLSWILSAMSISAKIIANKVRCARLEDVLGDVGSGNVQGEQQQKLDVISNNVLLRLLGGREGVAIVASEENEEPVIIRDDKAGEHRYCVLFDPLDGSSNLDVCGGVGTIFSILRHDPGGRRGHDLQHPAPRPRRERRPDGPAAAGPRSGGSGLRAVRLVHRDGPDRRPRRGHVRARPGGRRVHARRARHPHARGEQELLGQRGQSPQLPGRLPEVPRLGAGTRLLVALRGLDGGRRAPHPAEAMLIEQAGGKALAAPGQRILDVQPKNIHERTPVVLGSAEEVDHVVAQLG